MTTTDDDNSKHKGDPSSSATTTTTTMLMMMMTPEQQQQSEQAPQQSSADVATTTVEHHHARTNDNNNYPDDNHSHVVHFAAAAAFEESSNLDDDQPHRHYHNRNNYPPPSTTKPQKKPRLLLMCFSTTMIPLALCCLASLFTFVGSWDCDYFHGAHITFTGGHYGLWTLSDATQKCQLWNVLFFNYTYDTSLVTARVCSMMVQLLSLALMAVMTQALQLHSISWLIGSTLFMAFLLSVILTTGLYNLWLFFFVFTYIIFVLIVRFCFIHPIRRRITNNGVRLIAIHCTLCAILSLATLIVLTSDFCTCTDISSEILAGREQPTSPCNGQCTMRSSGYIFIGAGILWAITALCVVQFGIQSPHLYTEDDIYDGQPHPMYGHYPRHSITTRVSRARGEIVTTAKTLGVGTYRTTIGVATSVLSRARSWSETSFGGVGVGSPSGTQDSAMHNNNNNNDDDTNNNNNDSLTSNHVFHHHHSNDDSQQPQRYCRDDEADNNEDGQQRNHNNINNINDNDYGETGGGGMGVYDNSNNTEYNADDMDDFIREQFGDDNNNAYPYTTPRVGGHDDDNRIMPRTNTTTRTTTATAAAAPDTRSCCQKWCFDYRITKRNKWEQCMFWSFRTSLGILVFFYILIITCKIGSYRENHLAAMAPDTSYNFITNVVCAFNESDSNQPFVTYNTKAEAILANMTVAHCGACGQCSNPHDIRMYVETRKSVAILAKRCGAVAVMGTYDELTDCLQDKIGFTRSCTECWSDNMISTAEHCLFTCLTTTLTGLAATNNVMGLGDTVWLNQCIYCDEKQSGPNFVQCSGVARRRLGIRSEIERDPAEQCTQTDVDWINANWTSIFPTTPVVGGGD